jgi:phage host-nuclease inhibitor protein Gam
MEKNAPVSAIRSGKMATTRQLRLRNLLMMFWQKDIERQKAHDGIEAEYAPKIEKLKREIEKISRSLIDYVQAHRAELSGRWSDAKRIRFESATFEWSDGKDSVDVFDEEKALASILKLEKRHPNIVRRSVEINKIYLHDHPELLEKIEGVRWKRRPLHIMRFDPNEPKIEHSPDNDSISIVVPKQKK